MQPTERQLSADRPRFLSEADCQDIAHRLARLGTGGGITFTAINSTWIGNVRWARNRISTSGEVRNDVVQVVRDINGAKNSWMLINDTSDAGLVAADRDAERVAKLHPQNAFEAIMEHYQLEAAPAPTLFFEATYQLDAERRAAAAQQLVQTAEAAGMLSAGYIEVGAHSMALIDTIGHVRYFPYTTARYSVTVRDPQGTGSGWAGVDWADWSRIDAVALTAIALDKCLKSRNPVAVEPGRYTTILEPQAVCDLAVWLVTTLNLTVWKTSTPSPNRAAPTDGPFSSNPPSWKARRGQKVIDERLSVRSDPLDPDLGFPPYNLVSGPLTSFDQKLDYPTYHPVTWIERGVLMNLAYDRDWARSDLHRNTGLPVQGAFRLSVHGATSTIDEMITTTKRGLLVTRFDGVQGLDYYSILQRGYTRDGLWLIEDGKISKAVKNMMFVESLLDALNNVEQVGVPQRAFNPMDTGSINATPQPVIAPPLKIKDFNFTALADAI